ncbi:MAG: hypothetical protein LR015_13435 [Verrucomicrobia bacterium]|nr:hypothetical protein [Verrucomicrobiota bacterium]
MKATSELIEVPLSAQDWLMNREDPRVLEWLKEENRRTDEALGYLQPLRDKLYRELVGRVVEDDTSVPYFFNGYWYYHRKPEGQRLPGLLSP